MRCEVIAVGTELLLGQIVDTNSAWIGEQLASAGIDSHFQTKVGDNHGRMVACLRLALERSDAVILCGGLGPTQDDITRETIAEVMGVGFTRRPEIGEKIRALFAARGRVMPDNNLRQADVPDGASVIPQMPGTAPGLVCPIGDKVVYAVPGVPHEMREMVSGTVIPDLRQRVGVGAVIRSRVLRTWGHSESGLAELLADRIDELDRLGNPTLAFQASGIEGLKVRITAKAPDDQAAEAVLADEEARRGRVGDRRFDGGPLERRARRRPGVSRRCGLPRRGARSRPARPAQRNPGERRGGPDHSRGRTPTIGRRRGPCRHRRRRSRRGTGFSRRPVSRHGPERGGGSQGLADARQSQSKSAIRRDQLAGSSATAALEPLPLTQPRFPWRGRADMIGCRH
jgi:molybdenum cofactor synthesis domain-containing protein